MSGSILGTCSVNCGIMQVLEGEEPKTANYEELCVFVRRWRPSSYTVEPLTEVVIPEPTVSALKQKVSPTQLGQFSVGCSWLWSVYVVQAEWKQMEESPV